MCSLSDLRSVKARSTRMVRLFSFLFELCLATIGVAFFSAVTSVAALFIFRRDIGRNRGILETSQAEVNR